MHETDTLISDLTDPGCASYSNVLDAGLILQKSFPFTSQPCSHHLLSTAIPSTGDTSPLSLPSPNGDFLKDK